MAILDGKEVAEKIYEDLGRKIKNLRGKPKLAAILVGDDPASLVFLRQKEKSAKRIGVGFELIRKNSKISPALLKRVIKELNEDKTVNGIIVQKPLPPQINSDEIDLLVDPKKDVDGLNPNSSFIPATARGIVELLKHYSIPVEGRKVVVVGASKLSGKPTGVELEKKGALVSFCDEKTADLASKTREADILVVAVGKPKLIRADMVKKGAVVIDVGINKIYSFFLSQESQKISNSGTQNSDHSKSSTKLWPSKIVGDVDFDEVAKVASFITPVPGGVGPVTVASLMQNLIDAAAETS